MAREIYFITVYFGLAKIFLSFFSAYIYLRKIVCAHGKRENITKHTEMNTTAQNVLNAKH